MLLRGARQVGKSTLVRLFASEHGLRLAELNLERAHRLRGPFETLDPEVIMDAIASETGVDPRGQSKTLVFLDEIQAIPAAVQALRYFHEDRPDVAVLGAGSLLEVALEHAKVPMPVGRIESAWLSPMSFAEYLRALSDHEAEGAVRSFKPGSRIAGPLHERLSRHQRDYLFVGGMPEAVAVFTEDRDPAAISRIQRQLLDGYRDDFAKYSSGTTTQLLDLALTRIPALIGKKLKWVSVSPDHQSREIKRAVWLLQKAGVVHLVPHTNASGAPLLADADLEVTKPLFLDVGLANRLLGSDMRELSVVQPERLVNEGPLAEQFVGQHLAAQGGGGEGGRPQAFYWLREGRAGNAEVDFVVSHGREVVPVEVKSGSAGAMKSLFAFASSHGTRRALRFDLNPPSVQTVEAHGTRFELLSLPLYLAGEAWRGLG
jgi:hypothetical protein